jgi:hypothetical protein
MTRKQRLALLGAALSAFAALVAAATMVGQKAGVPQILILFCSGFGAGATVTATCLSRRKQA